MKTFEEMSKIDVSKQTEKKGKFSYLSWPYAVSEFRKNCPNGTWSITRHEGSPVLTIGQGCFVEILVTPDIDQPGVCFTQLHPILNAQNKPIQEPNAFDVNTSIQRCLVKAIALATGIGLYIYAGEDLPIGDEKDVADEQLANVEAWKTRCTGMFNENGLEGLRKWFGANSALILKECGTAGKQAVSDFCGTMKDKKALVKEVMEEAA